MTSKIYQDGDVMIVEADEDHPHGHIQVKKGNYWYSDFKQNTPNPWTSCDHGPVYRING